MFFGVKLNRSWFGIHNKVLNLHDWSLWYHELLHNNRKKQKSMDLAMDLWHSNMWKLSFINLRNIIVFKLFEHWTMLIVFLFLALILSIWLTIKLNNLVCPSICDAFFSASTQWVSLIFLHEDILTYMLKSDKIGFCKITFVV